MISRRYRYTFAFFRPLFRLYNRAVYNFRILPDPGLLPGQAAIVMANHVTNFDPFFIATGYRRPVFFVASDHIFRLGFVSKIITFLVAPIPIVKSHVDLRTIRTIHGIIKDGGIVGLFPEGNRNFNGLTGSIPSSTGKLIRQMKATLLLYKLHGGYLSEPRWANGVRKGHVRAELVRRLEPDELAQMSPDQISQIIQESISVDDYAEQRNKPIHYRGKRLAEFLERALFVCPKCRGLNTLRSCDDRFACGCGLAVRYNTLGFFEPDDPWTKEQHAAGSFMDTVAAWDTWQRKDLAEMLDQTDLIDLSGQRPIFTDEQEVLVDCERAARSVRIDTGRLTLFADRLEFSGTKSGLRVYPLEKLDRVIMHGSQVLQFSVTGGPVLELRSKLPRSAYKYIILHYMLMQRRTGEVHGFFGF